LLYKTLIRPILTYGSEFWLLNKDGNTLRILERRILIVIYVPIEDNGIWIAIYNSEHYTHYDERDIQVKVLKTGRLRWLGQLFRMQELDPCRKLTVFRPEGTRRVGKLELRWLESVEEDLQKMILRY
jgi:hypothetical protein